MLTFVLFHYYLPYIANNILLFNIGYVCYLIHFIWWVIVLSLYFLYRKMPSLLEYLSYNCNFMGILAGPTCSYNDYIAFIEGRCYEPKHLESNGKENGKFKQNDPSPKVVYWLSSLAPSGDWIGVNVRAECCTHLGSHILSFIHIYNKMLIQGLDTLLFL